eukprot:SAG31_NODE_37947_length_300_cov_0.771144_1_plen_56_part_01
MFLIHGVKHTEWLAQKPLRVLDVVLLLLDCSFYWRRWMADKHCGEAILPCAALFVV